MNERKKIQIEQSIEFEKSGEILSICIKIENISPEINRELVISQLDVIYKNLINDNFIC